jgi:hypothetical protein
MKKLLFFVFALCSLLSAVADNAMPRDDQFEHLVRQYYADHEDVYQKKNDEAWVYTITVVVEDSNSSIASKETYKLDNDMLVKASPNSPFAISSSVYPYQNLILKSLPSSFTIIKEQDISNGGPCQCTFGIVRREWTLQAEQPGEYDLIFERNNYGDNSKKELYIIHVIVQ